MLNGPRNEAEWPMRRKVRSGVLSEWGGAIDADLPPHEQLAAHVDVDFAALEVTAQGERPTTRFSSRRDLQLRTADD